MSLALLVTNFTSNTCPVNQTFNVFTPFNFIIDSVETYNITSPLYIKIATVALSTLFGAYGYYSHLYGFSQFDYIFPSVALLTPMQFGVIFGVVAGIIMVIQTGATIRHVNTYGTLMGQDMHHSKNLFRLPPRRF